MTEAAAPSDSPSRRMVLVHAHPDDECIGTGAAMARYASEGVGVTLLTCTRGEEGEVLVPDLSHLASVHTDSLGHHREEELAEAMRILGVSDHRFLGAPGEFRDSGMMGEPSNDRPECFWRADLLDAATRVAAVLREVRPQVLVTYDHNGGYGHPDHIQAHRAAMYGCVLAAASSFRTDLGPAWDVPKVYWTAVPRSYVQQGIDAMVAAGGSAFFGTEDAGDLPFVVEDDVVTTRLDGRAFEPRKMAALRAHATQVEADGAFFQMADALGPDAMGWEFFALARGERGDVDDDSGFETDLFAGLAG
jgi:N-acetyl-1-D-myo-inositol-2-amino-2-deoxy-alpha-D-glucopyranoside deacetylase